MKENKKQVLTALTENHIEAISKKLYKNMKQKNNIFIYIGFTTGANAPDLLVLDEWSMYMYGNGTDYVDNVDISISSDNFFTSTSVFGGPVVQPISSSFVNVATTPFEFANNTTYRIRFCFYGDADQFGRWDGFGFNFTCLTDTDGDGIPDHRDTDSDGDGCPDAVEGGENFTRNDLSPKDDLGTMVNEAGVPVIANKGQAVGSSKDGSNAGSCAALPRLGNLNNFNLYPNPTIDRVIIEFESTEEQERNIYIYDIAGKKHLSEQVTSGKEVVLDVHHLPTGIYAVEVNNGFNSRTQKLIIQ